jgi:hypothetical protein
MQSQDESGAIEIDLKYKELMIKNKTILERALHFSEFYIQKLRRLRLIEIAFDQKIVYRNVNYSFTENDFL